MAISSDNPDSMSQPAAGSGTAVGGLIVIMPSPGDGKGSLIKMPVLIIEPLSTSMLPPEDKTILPVLSLVMVLPANDELPPDNVASLVTRVMLPEPPILNSAVPPKVISGAIRLRSPPSKKIEPSL